MIKEVKGKSSSIIVGSAPSENVKTGSFRGSLVRNDGGFSLIEMSVAIPLIAVMGGIMTLSIAANVKTVKVLSDTKKSASDIEQLGSMVRSASNCYSLKNTLANASVLNDTGGGASNKGYVISATLNGQEVNTDNINGDTIKCFTINSDNTSEKVNTVVLTAKRTSSGEERTLYSATFAKFLS